jgi:hypothetical protein
VIGDRLLFEVVVHEPQPLADAILDGAAHRFITEAVSTVGPSLGEEGIARLLVLAAAQWNAQNINFP